jgi:hypothetical protein
MPFVTVKYFLLCDTESCLLSWAYTETTIKRTAVLPPSESNFSEKKIPPMWLRPTAE